MREFKLIMIALVTTLSCGIANADESEEMEVLVVTAMRPGTIEAPEIVAVEKTPAIDFSELALEAPSLDPAEFKLAPERIDLALRDEANSQF